MMLLRVSQLKESGAYLLLYQFNSRGPGRRQKQVNGRNNLKWSDCDWASGLSSKPTPIGSGLHSEVRGCSYFRGIPLCCSSVTPKVPFSIQI